MNAPKHLGRFSALFRVWPAVGFLSLSFGCSKPPSEAVKVSRHDRIIPVTVASVERKKVERTIDVVGTLKGWEEVTVGAKKTGRAVKVLKDMGDRIDPGQPLVYLDDVDARLAVEQAESRLAADLARIGLDEMPAGVFDVEGVPSVAKARIGVERAKTNLDRQRKLMRDRVGTVQDLQNYENDWKAAEASLRDAIVTARATLATAESSRAALRTARQALEDTVIRAPVPSKRPNGMNDPVVYEIVKKNASEGQMIREGDAVAELVVRNPLKLWTTVPERFAALIRIGQSVEIASPAFPDRKFQGTITRVNPAIDSSTRTFQVEAIVDNDDGALRPGGFAKAIIAIGTDEAAVVVPIGSVVHFAGVTKIFLVEKGKVAREVQVETAVENPRETWVEVTEPSGKPLALRSGSSVVVTGQSLLADGSNVVVKNASKRLDDRPARVASAE